MEHTDLVIIGAGPAGITAAIYAARQRIPAAVVTRDVGGQAAWSGDVENYTGYQMITGPELAAKFADHLSRYSISLREGITVTRVRGEAAGFLVETGGEPISCATVIVASGRTPRLLDVPGEEEFHNRGVTYCATCDGPLFADRDVAVVGGGNAGLDAALQLLGIARRIYLVERGDRLTADPVMIAKARTSGKVTEMTGARVEAILGDRFVTGIRVSRGGTVETVPVGGVFIEIGSIPNASFVEDVAKNGAGEIVVDCSCRTNIEGLFAAGDVTSVYAKQIIVACGEGAKAAIAAAAYLHRAEGGTAGHE